MTFKPLTIIEKNIGDPLDSVLTTRRTAAPQIIQPTYTFDPSDMYDFFIPCVSVGTDFYWESGLLEVSTGFAIGVFLKEASIGNGFSWNGAGLDVSVGNYRGIYNSGIGYDLLNDGTSGGEKWIFCRRLNAGPNIKITLEPGAYLTIDTSQDLSDMATLTYVDGSLLERDNSIAWNTTKNINQDTSIGILNNWNVNQDTSIGILNNWNINQDISIAFLDGVRRLDMLRDVSIVDLSTNNLLEYDGYIGYWKNAEPEEIDDYFYNKIWIDASVVLMSSPMNSSTATEIRFDKTIGYVYGSVDSPITSSLTTSLTGALLGVKNLIIHKNIGGLTCPSTFKKIYGTYNGSVNNFIQIQYLDPSNQIYSVYQII